MRDYLVARLESSDLKIESVTKELVSGIHSNYINVGDKGLVLLVDQIYPCKKEANGKKVTVLKQAYQVLYNNGAKNIALVFLKDGKTFFRSSIDDENTGLKSIKPKQEERRSFKDYKERDLMRINTFRPEENFVFDKRKGIMQYYQPSSDGLSEAVLSYNFEPVSLDYGHIKNEYKYHPLDSMSKVWRIWKNENRLIGQLVLQGKYLEGTQMQGLPRPDEKSSNNLINTKDLPLILANIRNMSIGGMTFENYESDRDPTGAIGIALADLAYHEQQRINKHRK